MKIMFLAFVFLVNSVYGGPQIMLNLRNYVRASYDEITGLGVEIDLMSVDVGGVALEGKEGLDTQYLLWLASDADAVDRVYASLVVFDENEQLIVESHLSNPDAIWIRKGRAERLKLRIYVSLADSSDTLFYDMRLDKPLD